MQINLPPIPEFGSQREILGFAWFPKMIVCGNKRTLIWFESFKIIEQFNVIDDEWRVVEFTIL